MLILEGSATIRVGSTSYSSVGSRVDVFGGTPPPVLLVEPGLEIEVQAESAATVIVTAILLVVGESLRIRISLRITSLSFSISSLVKTG